MTHDLPEFDPAAFVTSSDTLYSLSRKGAGSTAPLTSALVGQVLEAGIAAAMARPTARLAVPMLLVLDEAANICPLPDLPDMYSWLRKHAIMPMVFLQSPAQGVEAWGETGFKAITSQSVHIYGGNVDDRHYLEHWVALCGTAQIAHTSTSRGRGGAQPLDRLAHRTGLRRRRPRRPAPGPGPGPVPGEPARADPQTLLVHRPARRRPCTPPAAPPASPTTRPPPRPGAGCAPPHHPARPPRPRSWRSTPRPDHHRTGQSTTPPSGRDHHAAREL